MQYSTYFDRDNYDAAIIGSGISGLICGVNLALSGLSVLITEQAETAGGLTRVFRRDDFKFEAGGSFITGISREGEAFHDLLAEAGVNLRLEKIEPLYTTTIGERTVAAPGDPKLYARNLAEMFPREASNINKFFNDIPRIKQAIDQVLASGYSLSPLQMKIKHPLYARYVGKPAQVFLKDYFSDDDLISFMCAPTIYTTLPPGKLSFTSFVNEWTRYHLGTGLYRVEGGSQPLIDYLSHCIIGNRGQVVVNTRVDKIIINEGRATGIVTHRGDKVSARVVISAASDEQTYLKMIGPENLDPDFLKEVENKEVSNSFFRVYLGLKEAGGMGFNGATRFVRKQARIQYEKINNWDLDAISSEGIITVDGSEKAPKGFRSVNISCICPFNHPKDWYIHSGDKSFYRKFKEKIVLTIINSIGKHIPDLPDRTVLIEAASPLTIQRYTLVNRGAAWGPANTVKQEGAKRGNIYTPIENLYHVGQYVYPGAGIENCALSGMMAAGVILDEMFG